MYEPHVTPHQPVVEVDVERKPSATVSMSRLKEVRYVTLRCAKLYRL